MTLNLASITLTSSREAIIGDALKTVASWVDASILIDLGIEDQTVEVARSILGDRLHIVHYDWSNGRQAYELRNFGLEAAHRLGFNFAVTLDTDERLDPKQCRIREGLATTEDECIEIPSSDGDYRKERFFKLPFPGRFVGKSHEHVPRETCRKAKLDIMTFWELPKTFAQIQERSRGILPLVEEDLQGDPSNPRWHYYLGDTLFFLERYEEAEDAFRKCLDLCDSETIFRRWSLGRLAEIPMVTR